MNSPEANKTFPAEQILPLTSIRGLAALGIVIFHGNSHIPVQYAFLLNPVLGRFYLLVDLFFVMSGFIMAHVYGRMFSVKVSKGSYVSFIRARFARIYPLHLLTLTWMIALYFIFLRGPNVHLLPSDRELYNFPAILSNLLLIQAMGVERFGTWNSPSWSISTEWWVYMIFPFIAVYIAKIRTRSLVLLSLPLIASYWALMIFVMPFRTIPAGTIQAQANLDATWDYGFIRCLIGFSLGLIVHRLYTLQVAKKFARSVTVIVLLLVFVALPLLNAPDALIVMLFPPLVLLASQIPINQSNIFNSARLVWLGDISYSLYLTHFPLLYTMLEGIISLAQAATNKTSPVAHATGDVIAGLVALVIYTAICLLVASFTYRYFEVPCRKWLNPKRKQVELNLQ